MNSVINLQVSSNTHSPDKKPMPNTWAFTHYPETILKLTISQVTRNKAKALNNMLLYTSIMFMQYKLYDKCKTKKPFFNLLLSRNFNRNTHLPYFGSDLLQFL
jgi:hypothetical protein